MPETVITRSADETRRLATEAAGRLATLPRTSAAVVTLRGELGAGKTTFTQGFLSALGVDEPVSSPTFMLVHRYSLTGPFRDAYHVDAYRLNHASDLATLGLADAAADPTNVMLVEWPDIAADLLRPTLDVSFAHGSDESERRITLSWHA